MQTIHDFFDGSIPIPPMNVENINVGCSKLLQAVVHADIHVLDAVADIIDLLLDGWVTVFVVCRVLECWSISPQRLSESKRSWIPW
jgi:hypothetical protein